MSVLTNIFDSFFTGMLANWATALASAVLLVFNVSPVNTQAEKIDTDSMKLVFEDNFDGDKLNDKVWSSHNKYGIRKGGYWAGSQNSVKDGCLTIKTQYLEDGEFGPGWYNSGICTDESYLKKYGYFECRCKLPKGQGLWSAFWMMNSNVKTGNPAEMGAEIDIFESPFWFLGGKRSYRVTSNIHYNGYGLGTKYKNVIISQLDNDPYENFNTYGVKWTEDEYVFYVNGYEVARTDYGVSHEPEYMILSCEADGASGRPTYGWSGHINRNDKATFAADFVVDYVRVYDFA